jgi:ribosome-associated heat shock protein Hsp15
VRLNGVKATAPGKSLRVGDVLTIALERRVLVLKVRDTGERRGPYEQARELYEELGDQPHS